MSLKLKHGAAMVFLLCGCATPYQKASDSQSLGYNEEKIGEGVYKLTYMANALTQAEDALKYWHQRARELCASYDYDHNETLTMLTGKSYNPAIFSMQTFL